MNKEIVFNTETFVSRYYPLACEVEKRFQLNPVVVMAQAILETGWGQSVLARAHNNFFGMTAYGRANEFWTGEAVMLAQGSLLFRTYKSPLDSFMDYGRLITSSYKPAAEVSYRPDAFAKAIANSKYISEVNGDDRYAYRKALMSLSERVEREMCNVKSEKTSMYEEG